MSDKDQFNDEEYHFVEDPEMTELGNDEEVMVESQGKLKDTIAKMNENPGVRNALILLVLVIIAIIGYRCTASSSKKELIQTKIARPETFTSPPKVNLRATQPLAQITRSRAPTELKIAPQKLTALEQSQNNLQAEFDTMNKSMLGLNDRVATLVDKTSLLSQQLMDLKLAMEMQAKQMMELNKPQMVKIKPPVIKKEFIPYAIQAVIPGRAWLIGGDGSTMTVRKGTQVRGYGVVQYIDAVEGRVLTSSGRMIRFSQDDS